MSEQIIWTTYRRDLAKEGKRVLSYPNRKGVASVAVIEFVGGENILVKYNDHSVSKWLNLDGRTSDEYETNYDIGLIEK